jgi:sugar/nucleoside kinase (ribokinase family)
MRFDIITIGDAFEDVFVTPDLSVHSDRRLASGKGIIFELGEKIPLESIDYEIGGSACNTAVGLARLGYKTSIVSLLGDDTAMGKVSNKLRNENVDTSNLIIDKDKKTGFSIIFNLQGERTIFVYHAIDDYQKFKIKKNLRSKWYFLAPLGENSDAIEGHLIKEVAENGARIAWNPGSIQIAKGFSHFRHLLKCTSVLFLNREEATKFIDFAIHPTIEEVMKKLHNYGPKIIVITMGAEGAKVFDGNEFYETDSRPVQVVDSTGAGDAFAVGFLGRLIKEDFRVEISQRAISQALKSGIENSISVIQHLGAQKGLLNKINTMEK